MLIHLYNRLKWLYTAGRITETHLDAAVTKGWITVEEKNEIMEVEE